MMCKHAVATGQYTRAITNQKQFDTQHKSGSDQEKTWVTRDIPFHVDYAKSLLLRLTCIRDIPDMFTALIKGLLSVAKSSKKAVVKGKALKAICKIIKQRPENILDEDIQIIIKLRLKDPH